MLKKPAKTTRAIFEETVKLVRKWERENKKTKSLPQSLHYLVELALNKPLK